MQGNLFGKSLMFSTAFSDIVMYVFDKNINPMEFSEHFVNFFYFAHLSFLQAETCPLHIQTYIGIELFCISFKTPTVYMF